MVTRYEYFDSRNNRWNPYDAATCAFLESAEQANPNAIVQLQGLPFQVRFGQNARSQKMVSSTGILQVNVNTENSRDVRRVAPMQPSSSRVPSHTMEGLCAQFSLTAQSRAGACSERCNASNPNASFSVLAAGFSLMACFHVRMCNGSSASTHQRRMARLSCKVVHGLRL